MSLLFVPKNQGREKIMGKGIIIVEYENLDQLEKEINKLAGKLSIVNIKIRYDIYNLKKPWVAVILFSKEKRSGTLRIKVITQRTIKEIENMANQFADLYTIDDITAPHRLPAKTSDSMRHIETFVSFITYVDVR